VQEDFITYPSMLDYELLSDRIASFHSLPKRSVTLGTGSDTVIKQMFQLTCSTGSEVITTDPAFPMYGVYAKMYDAKLLTVNYDKNLCTNLEEIKSKVTDSTSLVVLANPNSPIGDYKSKEELDNLCSFLNKKGIPFLIDEAYCEYAKTAEYYECSKLAFKYDNVILTRTFSKAWGAAGARVGYAIAGDKLSNLMQNLRLTFPVTGASLKYISFLLDNQDEVFEYIKATRKEKSALVIALRDAGYDVIDSHVNWIHLNNSSDNVETVQIFKRNGVSIKENTIIPHDERSNWIRLTVGPNLATSKLIQEILGNKEL